MWLLALLLVVLAAKIVLIDSPVGAALGDAIRNLVPPRTPQGAASRSEMEELRHEVDQLRDRVDRLVDEQAFLTRLLSEPTRLQLKPGDIEGEDL